MRDLCLVIGMIELANRKLPKMARILTENDRPRQIILRLPPMSDTKTSSTGARPASNALTKGFAAKDNADFRHLS